MPKRGYGSLGLWRLWPGQLGNHGARADKIFPARSETAVGPSLATTDDGDRTASRPGELGDSGRIAQARRNRRADFGRTQAHSRAVGRRQDQTRRGRDAGQRYRRQRIRVNPSLPISEDRLVFLCVTRGASSAQAVWQHCRSARGCHIDARAEREHVDHNDHAAACAHGMQAGLSPLEADRGARLVG
jgi:hypothetical protein